MIDNNEFMGISAQMISQYLEQQGVDAKELGINLIDSSSMGNDRKGLFGITLSNNAYDTLFEIAFHDEKSQATLKALKIEADITFNINFKKKEEQQNESK